jgi:hypothetical protein
LNFVVAIFAVAGVCRDGVANAVKLCMSEISAVRVGCDRGSTAGIGWGALFRGRRVRLPQEIRLAVHSWGPAFKENAMLDKV